jgi:hypothetical protein
MTKTTPTSLFNRIKTQPEEVVKGLLSYIPFSTLVDPSVKVADLAMGGGDYLASVLKLRMEAGVPREQAVRTLYGFESNIMYLNRARWSMNLHDANLAILKASDLSNLRMEFDVIIGNPPYQDSSTKCYSKKLWMEFTFKSYELLRGGGYLALVTPQSFIGVTRVPATFRKVFTTESSLLKVNHDHGERFPGIGVDICSWAVQKKPYTGSTEVICSGESRILDIRKDLPTPFDKKFKQDLVAKIHTRFKESGLEAINLQRADIDLPADPEGEYTVYTSGRNKNYRTSEKPPTQGQWKFVVSGSASYKQWFVTQSAVTGHNFYVPVDSPEEGLAYGETLSIPEMVIYLDVWKRTSGFTPAIKNKDCLPDLRNLSEKKLQDIFKLTPEEQAVVSSHYKPYKEIERVI